MEFYKTECVDPPTDYITMIKRIRKITIIGIGLMVFQQTCGVNSVIFHMEWVFHDFCTTNELTSKAQNFVIGISIVQVSHLPHIISGIISISNLSVY